MTFTISHDGNIINCRMNNVLNFTTNGIIRICQKINA